MKVLVLDDDPLVRSFLQGFLVRYGHEVVSYPSPVACPIFTYPVCPCGMDGRCPDAVLTDVRMPGADGLTFTEELRRKGCRCQHVALMSGTWTDADLARSKRLGLTVFAKPFHADKLLVWLSRVEKTAASTAIHA